MPAQHQPLIGILGGMGPQAGLDLASKVASETRAERDQHHIPLVIFSVGDSIPDRTEFLLGHSETNPSAAIAHQFKKMAELGVSVAAMACNTAHAAAIFDSVKRKLAGAGVNPTILHLIDETVAFILSRYPELSKVGILGTRGTYQSELYDGPLRNAGLEPILPDPEIRNGTIHEAIFDPVSGIKSRSNPVSREARNRVFEAVEHLRGKGAELIVLGCTELPLAITNSHIDGVQLIDPTRIMARALIRATYPERLKP